MIDLILLQTTETSTAKSRFHVPAQHFRSTTIASSATIESYLNRMKNIIRILVNATKLLK